MSRSPRKGTEVRPDLKETPVEGPGNLKGLLLWGVKGLGSPLGPTERNEGNQTLQTSKVRSGRLPKVSLLPLRILFHGRRTP